MKLDDHRESDNVEDRRGMGAKGGIGIGTIVIALIAWYFGFDPQTVIDVAQVASPPQAQAPQEATRDEHSIFVSRVLASTEDAWDGIFREAGTGYRAPRLVLFTGSTPSACGTGQAAMGPFYCPGDEKVYIDLGFYDELRQRFGAPGDFAQAYVLAHEIGHHVQNVLGIERQVRQAQQRRPEQQNELSVRMELQADCFAGVWGKDAAARGMLEGGDLEEGLGAAAAVGDDRLQQMATGHVSPEGFTHGTSEQRMRWFRTGFESGDLARCDTFGAGAP